MTPWTRPPTTRPASIRGGAARALLLGLLLLCACARGPRWNVVLVTFDTTRADHIGDYGPGNHTPRLDALAAEGVRFARAYSAVPVTAPSHSTILTGKYPIAHGFRDNGLFVLGAEQQTLAEVLGEAGYSRAAAVGSFPLLARFGFDQGFELFDDDLTTAGGVPFGQAEERKLDLFFDDRPAAQVNAAVIPWLRRHADRPFFLWTHYFDPHQPHRPRPPYDQLLVGDSYRAEIAYADESFGALVDELRRLGAWERTLLVFTADHGEGLGEHLESTHSMLVYDSTLHVPLIVRVPGLEGGRVVEQRVGTVDIMPTVLDLLGLDPPPGIQGRSLAPLLRDGTPLPDRPLYAETLAPRLSHSWGELRALIEGGYKYVFGPRPELYDLDADPRELADLVDSRPELAESMQRRLAAFLRDNAVPDLPAPTDMDDETRARLVALGYLSGADASDEKIVDVLDPRGEAPQDRVVDISRMGSVKDHLLNGRVRDAKAEAEQLLEGSPENPYYEGLLAAAELGIGNMEEGLRLIRRVRDAYSNKHILAGYALRGADLLLRTGGDSELALELAAESLALYPTAAAQYAHARALLELGRRDESFDELLAALELDPGFVAARADLALELVRRGDRAAAESHLRQAIKDDPFAPRLYVLNARLAADGGRPAEAVRDLERALELDPDDLEARRALVAVLAERGLVDAARAQLAELQRLAPESEETAAARRLLEDEPAGGGAR